MVVFPNSKINLGLRILRKRKDGYHDIETIFYPVGLNDVLEIIVRKDQPQGVGFTRTGLNLDGDSADNLCIKAYKLIRRDYPQIPFLDIHLHKAVPAGAGLGGGSADAAFTLLLINKILDLRIPQEKLEHYALQLGSDCPFFLLNKPCFATGRGENLQPLKIDLSNYNIVVVNPGIHINTGKAFMNVKPYEEGMDVRSIENIPVERWKDHLINDFESAVFKLYPEIVDIKDQFYGKGASFAAMSGSGSTVFGIFPKQMKASLSFPPNYFVRELTGQG